MPDRRFIHSVPEIPDEGQPFALRRTPLVWLWLALPTIWLAVWAVALLVMATGPGGAPWAALGCVLPVGAVLLIGAVSQAQRVAGVWLAAEPDGVWVSHRPRRGADSYAIWVPWRHIESIFPLRANRDDSPRGSWHIVVRVRDLPTTLRPPESQGSDRATFAASTWLSNYDAREAIGVLSRLAAGRAPVG